MSKAQDRRDLLAVDKEIKALTGSSFYVSTTVANDGQVRVVFADGEVVEGVKEALAHAQRKLIDLERVYKGLTLLAAADTVYLYAIGDLNIDHMHAVLDVAYPGLEVLRRTMTAQTWESVRAELGADIKIVDVRHLD